MFISAPNVLAVGNRFKMLWIHACAISASMVKFLTLWNWAAIAFIEELVGHQKTTAFPNPCISIILSKWKFPAARNRVNGWLNILRPVWNCFTPSNPKHIFFMRDQFKMVRIYARAILAHVIEFKPFRNRPKSLLPMPYMAQEQFALSSNSGISIPIAGAHLPAAGLRVNCVCLALAVTWIVVQPVFANGMIVPGSLREWGYQSASAQTQTAFVLDSLDRSLGMVVEVTHVAAFDQLTGTSPLAAFSCNRNGLAASTETDPGWVGALGIVRSLVGQQSSVVAFQERFLALGGEWSIATARAKPDLAIHLTPPCSSHIGRSRLHSPLSMVNVVLFAVMPLLKGKFDPARFNAVKLAEGLCGSAWDEMDEDSRRVVIDKAQAALDQMWREGIIE